MKCAHIFFVLGWLLTLTSGVFAQKTQLRGQIVDSTRNIRLEGVSVSSFVGASDEIFQLQISQRFGYFIFNHLPVDTTITIKLDHLGYQSRSTTVRISPQTPMVDLGRISMAPIAHEIEAVDVLPPVRMKGDTVEFNTNAFHLDSNAVVEDLFHKLPGMIVWGDGKITYNGRNINNIVVDGKTFFGSDQKIITQNLPKNAVKKVQLYRTNSEPSGPTEAESDYEMNLQLHEDARAGYFGTLSLSGGTDDRYAALAALNAYTPRLQASLGFAKDNMNLGINNVETLLSGTAFGGVNARSEFYSDFFQTGVTEGTLYAGRMRYDFNKKDPKKYVNLLKLDVYRHDTEHVVTDTSTTTHFGDTVDRESARDFRQLGRSEKFRVAPEYTYENEKTAFSARIQLMDDLRNDETTGTSLEQYDQAMTMSRTETRDDRRQSGAEAQLTLSNKPTTTLRAPAWQRIRYRLTYDGMMSTDENTAYSSRFVSSTNSDLPYAANVSRQYASDREVQSNAFALRLDDLQQLYRTSGGIQVSLDSYFRQSKRMEEVLVEDIEAGSGGVAVSTNRALSHDSEYEDRQFYSELSLSRNMVLDSHGQRFRKSLRLEGGLKAGGQQWENTSTLAFRNLARGYYSLLPSAAVAYHHEKQTTSQRTYRVRAYLSENNPTLEQIAPIYDDINAFYRFYGGGDLTREQARNLELSYRFLQMWVGGYDVHVNYTRSEWRNAITDSLIFEPYYQEHYLVNTDKQAVRHAASAGVMKYFVHREHNKFTIQAQLGGNIRNRDRFVNEARQELKQSTYHQDITLTYSYRDRAQLSYKNYFRRTYTSQRALSDRTTRRHTGELNNDLSMTYVFAKKLYVNTNVNSRAFYGDGMNAEIIIIWNASMRYRVLKGNNLELKLTALDLLGENKGFYITNNERMQTYGVRNVLTQYFMVGLTYYPRNFQIRR